jgi:hypothetical protein
VISRITLQGLPAANTWSGMSRATTLPAPMTDWEPIRTPGQMIPPPPTPDKQRAVHCDIVLELILSATKSLLFQIPYIAMPPDPQQDRRYIGLLIREFTACQA